MRRLIIEGVALLLCFLVLHGWVLPPVVSAYSTPVFIFGLSCCFAYAALGAWWVVYRIPAYINQLNKLKESNHSA